MKGLPQPNELTLVIRLIHIRLIAIRALLRDLPQIVNRRARPRIVRLLLLYVGVGLPRRDHRHMVHALPPQRRYGRLVARTRERSRCRRQDDQARGRLIRG